MIRLIEQYLYEHGFEDIARELQTKSHVQMEDTSVQDFRQAVMNGEYGIARSLLSQFTSLTE